MQLKMHVHLSENQIQIIDRIAQQNDFSKYKLITNPGSEKGDNFLGVLTLVKIVYKDRKLQFILKTAQQHEAMRQAVPLEEIYSREIYMYKIIFKEFIKFQKDCNIQKPFRSVAKFFDASTDKGQELLVLEDLTVQRFQLWNRKLPMNSNHISVILTEYAKFHATSLAMKCKNPNLFKKLTNKISDSPFETTDPNSENLFLTLAQDTTDKIMEVVEDHPNLVSFLKMFKTKIASIFLEKIKHPDHKMVLIHGDCWCNNFMFKYQDSKCHKQPVDMRIIDWQNSCLWSPAFDVCYAFLVNSSKEVLDNYTTYMHLYYNEVKNMLINFSCDPEEIFPYSMFENHLKIYMPVGMYMCFMLLKMMVSDSGEIADLTETGDTNMNDRIKNQLNIKIKNCDVYKQRIINIISFMTDNKFLN